MYDVYICDGDIFNVDNPYGQICFKGLSWPDANTLALSALKQGFDVLFRCAITNDK